MAFSTLSCGSFSVFPTAFNSARRASASGYRTAGIFSRQRSTTFPNPPRPPGPVFRDAGSAFRGGSNT